VSFIKNVRTRRGPQLSLSASSVTITGSLIGTSVSGTTAQFSQITSSAVLINNTLSVIGVSTLDGVSGTTAQFTSITGSHSGSGAGLTGIPNAALVNSAITIGTTSVSLGGSATTIQGVTVLTGSTVTGSTALFTTITGSTVTGSSAQFNYITGTAFFANFNGFPSGGLSAQERLNIESFTKIYASGSITAQSGTAANPAFNFGVQPGSGMFWAANAQIGFSAGGTEAVRIIRSSGIPRIGIGEISPTALVHATLGTAVFDQCKVLVENTTAGNTNASYELQSTQGLKAKYFLVPYNANTIGEWFNGGVIHATGSTSLTKDTNLYYSATTHRWYRNAGSGSADRIMTLDTSGNLGLGVLNPSLRLDVSGSAVISGSLIVSGAFYGNLTQISSSTTNYTLVAADTGKTITINSGSAVTLTVPTGLPVGFNTDIIQLGAGQITVSGAVGVTINNRQSQTKTAGQYAVVSLLSRAADLFILSGDTGA
jgi:hypothetical protein